MLWWPSSPHPICSPPPGPLRVVSSLWIPSFPWVPLAGQARLPGWTGQKGLASTILPWSSFSHPACLCCLPVPRDTSTPTPTPTHISPLPPTGVFCPRTPASPTQRTTLPRIAGQPLWTFGKRDSHTLHTLTLSNCPSLQTLLHPPQSQSLLQSLSPFPRLQPTGPDHIHAPASRRQFVLDTSPRRSLPVPCFLAFWDTAPVPLGPWTVDPDHCTPPIRPKKQEGRACSPRPGHGTLIR